MRSLTLLFYALFGSTAAEAQGPNATPPVYGVHYSFEKMTAFRRVDDRHDRGMIKLVSDVYRPLRGDRREVVVDLHGSLGGMAVAPNEPLPPIGRSKLRLLLEQGYTIVVPRRRGIGESGGTYVEECAYQAGRCTLADYRALMPAALADAVASTESVIRQVVFSRLRPSSGKVILWGGSRGGFLALQYAALHPNEVRAVVAVSPGWLSISDKWPRAETVERVRLQSQFLARYGASYHGPTLWVYAARDPFYAGTSARDFFEAFKSAGGQGKWVFISEHSLASSHVPPVDLWRADAEAFLKATSVSSRQAGESVSP